MELKDLVGKKIIKIEANGFMVKIITEDGILFQYDATDGGYSRYEITKLEKKEIFEKLEWDKNDFTYPEGNLMSEETADMLIEMQDKINEIIDYLED